VEVSVSVRCPLLMGWPPGLGVAPPRIEKGRAPPIGDTEPAPWPMPRAPPESGGAPWRPTPYCRSLTIQVNGTPLRWVTSLSAPPLSGPTVVGSQHTRRPRVVVAVQSLRHPDRMALIRTEPCGHHPNGYSGSAMEASLQDSVARLAVPVGASARGGGCDAVLLACAALLRSVALV
jgi:hypothetical protein